MASDAFQKLLTESPKGIIVEVDDETTYVPTYAACDSLLQYWANKIPPWEHKQVTLHILLPSRRVDLTFSINMNDGHIETHTIAKTIAWDCPGLN